MYGLGEIRSINSWAKSEECARLARATNSAGTPDHKDRVAAKRPAKKGKVVKC